jgi:hypothetical protein
MEVTKGPARKLIPAREWMDKNEIRTLTDAGVIITDERRNRTLFTDGHFLTARDLTRDQNYFLTRQADLGQAGGAGVVHGLLVRMVEGSAIGIEAGHGVTTSGELVVIPRTIQRLDLTNIPEMQRLNAAFGLSQIPNEPARTRSGLFVLALRPVEYTANPIATYPTSIDGARTIEDGDVVEAVAITLIPYPDEGARAEVNLRRSRIARKIFVEGGTQGVPAGVLPLAMIALDRGVVRWVDSFMVRREVGAEHGNIVGLGFAPRALREAHLLQYEYQLREVIRERAVRGLRFAASEHFMSLPAVGQMPAAAIDVANFTQIFFPASVQVDLSIVPADELPSLIAEGLRLPPIDLTLDEEQLASTAVLALIPMSRQDFKSFQGKLNNLPRRLATAAPDMIAKRPPIEALRLLKIPFTAEAVRTGGYFDEEWRAALSKASLLWYMRRSNLSNKVELAGNPMEVFIFDERKFEAKLKETLEAAGLTATFARLQSFATAYGNAAMISFLAVPMFAHSQILLQAAIQQLAQEIEGGITRAAVQRVAANFSDSQLGEGLARFERANPNIATNPRVIETIVSSGTMHEIARRANQSSAESLRDLGLEVAGGTPGIGRTPTKGATKDTTQGTTRDTTKGTTKETTKDTTKGTTKETTRDTTRDTTKETSKGTTRDTSKGTTKGTTRDPTKGVAAPSKRRASAKGAARPASKATEHSTSPAEEAGELAAAPGSATKTAAKKSARRRSSKKAKEE